MDTSYCRTTLEILLDEILLEVCKYLLCGDVLHSFMGLNYRMTRMIAQYRHHLSFHKTSITMFDSLCLNIIPQISSQIRSLVINCYYSVLQDASFLKHFSEKMSISFPNLERISLISYEHDDLVAFLNTLHDLNRLVENRLYKLPSIEELQQPTLARLLMQVNNHRLTTVLIDTDSSVLSFYDSDCYLNIVRLRLNLNTTTDISSLFAAVPNVQDLDVTIRQGDSFNTIDNENLISPLFHLTNFKLKSFVHRWSLDELMMLFVQLPIIQSISLSLLTNDKRLVEGDKVRSILPSTLQQFNYAIAYLSDTVSDEIDTIVSSWPTSNPIAYFFDNHFLFLHTLPWNFNRLEFPSVVGGMMSWQTINTYGYDKHVEELFLFVNKNFSLAKSLILLSQCRRVREITINVTDNSEIITEQESLVSSIPKLPRVTQICFEGSMPSDLNYFSIIFNALPNLFFFDLPLDHILKLIEEPQIRSILNERITSLGIEDNQVDSVGEKLNEQHIWMIASAFSRVRDLYVNIMHLQSSEVIRWANESDFEHLYKRILLRGSSEEEIGPILSLSSESMLLCILTAFNEHKLTALCVDGHFINEVETDTEQWLRVNTNLGEQPFQAAYHREVNRLLIWM